MTRHHAFGAVDGDDFADNQMRARSFVSKLGCPMQAAFKMDGRLRDSAWADQRRWQRMKSDFRDFAD
jgi:hypothetical protein